MLVLRRLDHRLCLGVGIGCAFHLVALVDRRLLQLLDHRLVLFGRLDAADAERDDLDAVLLAPDAGELLLQRLAELIRVSGQRAVADPEVGDLRERGLQSCQELGAQLVLDLGPSVLIVHVRGDVLVEQDRVGQAIGILAEAADRDVDVETDVPVDDAVRNRAGRAVFVPDDILCVEIIDALVLGSHAAVGETGLELVEGREHALSEAAAEDAGFRRSVIRVGARLRAQVHDRALVHDDHALALVDHDR